MGLSKKQREIIIGLILGDGYVQMTGKRNARLRIEHSNKQKDYIFWKYEELRSMMQSKPKLIRRFNPIWEKRFSYYRCQTHSSYDLGRIRSRFYNNGKKIVPENIEKYLKSELTLAVWYMDDGYLYHRDKISYIYLPKYCKEDQKKISDALQSNYQLSPRVIEKKKGNLVLRFSVKDTRSLCKIVSPFVIPSMKYKLLPTP